ncbi:MAG: tail fiber protein [Bacteroidota bacterium]
MNTSKTLTIASATAIVLAIFGLSVLFTSSSSTEEAQQHLISKLTADVEAMQTEIQSLQEESPANSTLDPFIGQIIMFGGNFAPRGWAFCEGQLLAINSNQALFSLLGTTYGGDGRTTFALPDLRGRAPVHAGTGPGLPTIQLGRRYGSESAQFTVQPNVSTIPFSGRRGSGSSDNIVTNVTLNVNNGQSTISTVGPRLGVNYIIALQGFFPSRN